jgi:hypothetical protein
MREFLMPIAEAAFKYGFLEGSLAGPGLDVVSVAYALGVPVRPCLDPAGYDCLNWTAFGLLKHRAQERYCSTGLEWLLGYLASLRRIFFDGCFSHSLSGKFVWDGEFPIAFPTEYLILVDDADLMSRWNAYQDPLKDVVRFSWPTRLWDMDPQDIPVGFDSEAELSPFMDSGEDSMDEASSDVVDGSPDDPGEDLRPSLFGRHIGSITFDSAGLDVVGASPASPDSSLGVGPSDDFSRPIGFALRISDTPPPAYQTSPPLPTSDCGCRASVDSPLESTPSLHG